MAYFMTRAELLAWGQNMDKCDKIDFISYQTEDTALLSWVWWLGHRNFPSFPVTTKVDMDSNKNHLDYLKQDFLAVYGQEH